MADVTQSLTQMGQGLKAGLGTTTHYIMIVFVVGVILAVISVLFYSYYNKKSHNYDVVILRSRGGTSSFDWDSGYIGKHYVDRAKETRFKIYNAKKFGLRYNNEAIQPKFILKKFIAGKSKPMVFMSPNDEGWLQPVQMNLDAAKTLEATVSNADISYFQTELELMDAMFNKKGFLERYYLFILILLMLVVVAIQWYAASQIKAASLNEKAAAEAVSSALRYIGDKFGNGTTTQVIPIG